MAQMINDSWFNCSYLLKVSNQITGDNGGRVALLAQIRSNIKHSLDYCCDAELPPDI